MLASLSRLQTFITDKLAWTHADEVEYYLSPEQWTQVSEILEDLLPARKATAQLQRQDMTLGEFFAIWSGVVMVLKQTKNKGSALAGKLLLAMEKRAKGVMYKDRSKGHKVSPLLDYPGFQVAVFLDPRFFSLLKPDQGQEAKEYLLDLADRMEAVEGPAVDVSTKFLSVEGPSLFSALLDRANKAKLEATGAAQTTTSGERNGRTGRRALLRALLDEHDRTTVPLSPTENVFQWWHKKQFTSPELYKLALVVLSIPATQVSVERLFSCPRFILRPQRLGLSSSHVDDVAFLHANKDVVKGLLDELLKIGSHGQNQESLMALAKILTQSRPRKRYELINEILRFSDFASTIDISFVTLN
ncbi:uncharacterized protein LOC117646569 [Thrips palmi]|uniref:Uncharacterized protein LOC117646569 n=1 Tax=Thrips palmi TaxID=161013 RepID=A0A6P8Z929_THRPL|nr:uncharacterized protein LOC117646569 [Thrips palmi]